MKCSSHVWNVPKSSPGFLSKAELIRTRAVFTSSVEEAPWPPASDMPWSPHRTSRAGKRASFSWKAEEKPLDCIHMRTHDLAQKATSDFTFSLEIAALFIN